MNQNETLYHKKFRLLLSQSPLPDDLAERYRTLIKELNIDDPTILKCGWSAIIDAIAHKEFIESQK